MKQANALNKKADVLQDQVNGLKWVLSPNFACDPEIQASAASIEQRSPDDYGRAKRILADLRLSLDELRDKIRYLPPVDILMCPASIEMPSNDSNAEPDFYRF